MHTCVFCQLASRFVTIVCGGPLAASLCNADPRLRMHASEYLLPSLLKIHAKCPLALCSEIRALPTGDELAADLRIDTESWTTTELQYFGLVHVCLQSRLAALPTGCELQENGEIGRAHV